MEPLADQVGAWLRTRISSGELVAGTVLAEGTLAEEAGVSRSPVREALRRLAEEGLIILRPRRRPVVAETSKDDATNLYAMRKLIEPQCHHNAILHVTETQVQALDRQMRATLEAANQRSSNEYENGLRRYYQLLQAACTNRYMTEVVERLQSSSIRYWHILLPDDRYVDASKEANKSLHRAVVDRDAAHGQVCSELILELALQQIAIHLSPNSAKMPDHSTRT